MDLIYIPFIIIIGFVFIKRFRKQLSKKEVSVLKKLWGFHLITILGYYFFTRNGGGDAWGYWLKSKEMLPSDFWTYLLNEKGTYFLFSFNYFPSNVLDMGFFANTLLFGFFGFMGLAYFYVIAIKTIPFNFKLGRYSVFPLVFFLPNLHFWSSGVGKDSLLFLSIGMFSYALLSLSKRFLLIIISLSLAFFIRPHMVLFMLLTFGLAYTINSNVGGAKRFFLSALLIGGGIIILPSVLEFVKVEDISTESVEEFSEDKSALLSREGTGSSLGASASFPAKLFAFYFRPFFFDANSLTALIASFENLILFILGIKALRRKPLLAFKKAPFIVKGFLIFMLIGSIAFSLALGNVGIMIRMRNMFLPGFIIFILWTLSYAHERKLKSQNKHS
jgi:hypothetical protein